MLIRHTYVPGWQLPGGGVEVGETADEALARELLEECEVALTGPAALRSVHFNRQSSRRDHVLFYLVSDFRVSAPKMPDREIAEAGFFPLDSLPDRHDAGNAAAAGRDFRRSGGVGVLVSRSEPAHAGFRQPRRDCAAPNSRSPARPARCASG